MCYHHLPTQASKLSIIVEKHKKKGGGGKKEEDRKKKLHIPNKLKGYFVFYGDILGSSEACSLGKIFVFQIHKTVFVVPKYLPESNFHLPWAIRQALNMWHPGTRPFILNLESSYNLINNQICLSTNPIHDRYKSI